MIALTIFTIGLVSAVWVFGPFNHERSQTRAWYDAAPVATTTIRARRPKRRPF